MRSSPRSAAAPPRPPAGVPNGADWRIGPQLSLGLQRPSQADRRHRHRPVPRRLPGALPRPVRRLPASAFSSTTARTFPTAITTTPTPAPLPDTPLCSPAPTATATASPTTSGGIRRRSGWSPPSKTTPPSCSASQESKTGSSPHNLLADTIGDELKLATQGKARVFGVSLKDRAAILPAGFAGDAAYWIDAAKRCLGYLHLLPRQSPQVGAGFQLDSSCEILGSRMERCAGRVLRSTAHRKNEDGSDAGFYHVVGSTAFANEYEFEFAKELMLYENVGRAQPPTCFPSVLSPNDILGHGSVRIRPKCSRWLSISIVSLPSFINFLGHQIGLANVWIALSADHGVSSLPDAVKKLHIPAANLGTKKLEADQYRDHRKVFCRTSRHLPEARLSSRLARRGCLRRRPRART